MNPIELTQKILDLLRDSKATTEEIRTALKLTNTMIDYLCSSSSANQGQKSPQFQQAYSKQS